MNSTLPDKLLVVWTSADREVALNMVLMYAHNAQRHHWWEQVTLLIWGPSQQLVLQDAEVREKVAEMHGTACACSPAAAARIIMALPRTWAPSASRCSAPARH